MTSSATVIRRRPTLGVSRLATRVAAVTSVVAIGCGGPQAISTSRTLQLPDLVTHDVWEETSPKGHEARGVRRNLAPGDSLTFDNTVIRLDSMTRGGGEVADTAVFSLRMPGGVSFHRVAEGMAFSRRGYRIAILAAHTQEGELGGGKTEFEVGMLADLPDEIATATVAGGPDYRLRILHRPSQITLHHSGSAEPLRPDDDVAAKLRALQAWSETDRNWWDVPYHFLLGLDGRIYEGRDYRYRGETNTRYDVDGHLLISVLGNYELQDSTPEQIEAITDLMAWAVSEFDIPLDSIHGHSDVAETTCPGKNLRKYLDDGTFRRGIVDRVRLLSD